MPQTRTQQMMEDAVKWHRVVEERGREGGGTVTDVGGYHCSDCNDYHEGEKQCDVCGYEPDLPGKDPEKYLFVPPTWEELRTMTGWDLPRGTVDLATMLQIANQKVQRNLARK